MTTFANLPAFRWNLCSIFLSEQFIYGDQNHIPQLILQKALIFVAPSLLIILLTPLIAFSCPFHSCVIIFQEKKLIFKTEGNSLEITRYKSKSIPPGKSYCFSLICSMWFIVKLIIHSLQKKKQKKKTMREYQQIKLMFWIISDILGLPNPPGPTSPPQPLAPPSKPPTVFQAQLSPATKPAAATLSAPQFQSRSGTKAPGTSSSLASGRPFRFNCLCGYATNKKSNYDKHIKCVHFKVGTLSVCSSVHF